MSNIKKGNIYIYILIYIAISLIIIGISSQCITISIRYQSDQPGVIQLYYDNNIKTGYYFDEEHSQRKDIQNIDEEINTTFYINAQSMDKFRVDFEGMEKVIISKINIGVMNIPIMNYTVDDLVNKFDLHNDISSVRQEDSLIMTIQGSDAFIGTTQGSTIQVIGILTFMVMGVSLIITGIVVYLFNHKLRAMNIRINKGSLLILIFCLILIAPTITYNFIIGIDKNNSENRTLKEKPRLTLNTLTNYPVQYEEYYNDHIPFKGPMVKINNFIKYYLLNTSPAEYVVKGKNDWLFYNSKYRNDADTLADYLGTNIYSVEEMEIIKEKLLEKQKYLKEQGIEFYVLICPNKSQIYNEYMPEYYVKQNEEGKVDVLVKYLKDHTDLNIIYPKQELLNLKKEYNLYYKWDTHWNPIGAYVGFSELMTGMNRGKEIIPINQLVFVEQEYLNGDLAKMINIVPKGKDYTYLVENYKNDISTTLINSEGSRLIHYGSSNLNGQKLLMFRDSFSSALIPYLNKEFEESIYIWEHKFDKDIIEREKPQIVIFELVERFADVLKN